MKIKENEPPKTSLTVKLVCGAIAGVIGTCVIFPLDIIKTRLQNQATGSMTAKEHKSTMIKNPISPSTSQKPVIYNGMFDAGRKIIAQQGFKSLYNGLLPNLVGIIPEKAIKLAVNDYSREYWGGRLGMNPDKIPLGYGIVSGATAGICQVVATNPMEIVKIQLQLATSNLSTGEVVKKMGIRGLYKGTFATLARDVPFSMVFFSLVSTFKEWSTRENEKTPLYAVFGSGIVSGAIAAGLVTPMDVVKTRLQVTPKPGDRIYKGQLDCYRTIIQNEGPKALLKGIVPRMLIVSPLFAITVLVYEFQQRLFA